MNQQLKPSILRQHLAPQRLLTTLAAKIARSQRPWLKNWAIKRFLKQYPVDLSDAIITDPYAYQCFNDFFTRRLTPQARPITPDPKAFTSPVDGTLANLGRLNKNEMIQAKGKSFTVEALLGNHTERAEAFEYGSYATIYLAPENYHRIHMPLPGVLTGMTYIPGKLFSVSLETADAIPNLFARNERLVCMFQTQIGPVALILVGAMLVAGIHTTWSGRVTPHAGRKRVQNWYYTEPKIELEKGEEFGHFQFGSTVIILTPENTLHWNDSLQSGMPVKLGQTLGELHHVTQ